ncbi:hypothetical protein MKW92_023770 [Papaver armeniacum]|nr:hypothetical protein MKW92_023770 [Papaver armeniacum]
MAICSVFEGHNSTKHERKLGKYNGPCLATNPIDRCWRCREDWANDRKNLADCALGFGRHPRGKKKGKFYIVTDPSDDYLVNSQAWNIEIWCRAGLTIQYVRNVIIHGLHIHGGSGGLIRDPLDQFRTSSAGDGIFVFGKSHVWIDHNSMSNCKDGLVDVMMGSTAITISNNHMTSHNEVMLVGASDSYSNDTRMQITLAFNHFGRGLVPRMPRCRWGFFRVLNNDYTHWLMYAIGGSQNLTIIGQGNRFIAPPNLFAKEVTKRDYATEDLWK